MACLRLFEERLHLIETIWPEETDIQFILDVLAEYLGAFYTLENCAADEERWRNFLKVADEKPGSPNEIRAFLIAIHDCIKSSRDIVVPENITQEIRKRIDDRRTRAADA